MHHTKDQASVMFCLDGKTNTTYLYSVNLMKFLMSIQFLKSLKYRYYLIHTWIFPWINQIRIILIYFVLLCVNS